MIIELFPPINCALTCHQHDKIIYQWNNTVRAYPDNNLSLLFESFVHQVPVIKFIEFGKRIITCKEFNKKSYHLQWLLRSDYINIKSEFFPLNNNGKQYNNGLTDSVIKSIGGYVLPFTKIKIVIIKFLYSFFTKVMNGNYYTFYRIGMNFIKSIQLQINRDNFPE